MKTSNTPLLSLVASGKKVVFSDEGQEEVFRSLQTVSPTCGGCTVKCEAYGILPRPTVTARLLHNHEAANAEKGGVRNTSRQASRQGGFLALIGRCFVPSWLLSNRALNVRSAVVRSVAHRRESDYWCEKDEIGSLLYRPVVILGAKNAFRFYRVLPHTHLVLPTVPARCVSARLLVRPCTVQCSKYF